MSVNSVIVDFYILKGFLQIQMNYSCVYIYITLYVIIKSIFMLVLDYIVFSFMLVIEYFVLIWIFNSQTKVICGLLPDV